MIITFCYSEEVKIVCGILRYLLTKHFIWILVFYIFVKITLYKFNVFSGNLCFVSHLLCQECYIEIIRVQITLTFLYVCVG